MPNTVGYFGMRGSGDWNADERPRNWREKILQLFPNGDTPLTGILSKTKSQTTDDPSFYWWEEPLAAQSGALSGLYTDVALSTGYTTSDSLAVGATIYAKVPESVVNEVRIGHMVMLRYEGDTDRDKRAFVVNRAANGASSVLTLKMREADSASASNLSTANKIMVIGNSNAEGATMPDGVQYDPTKFTNVTQIFRTPLRLTGTAIETNLRTTNGYKHQKAKCLQYHGIEMEKALLYNGDAYEGVGTNGKPQRETAGLIKWIRDNAPDNVDNYVTTSDLSTTTTWANGGKDWLDSKFEEIFKRGRGRKLGICGTGALTGINNLAQQYGSVQLQPAAKAYGLEVREWITPFGKIDLMTHPLFSEVPGESNTILIVEPENIITRPLRNRDTRYKKDDRIDKGGAQGVDGIEEEYITELGWEFHHARTMGYLTGVGLPHP